MPFDKIQYPFPFNTLHALGKEGNFPLVQDYQSQTLANMTVDIYPLSPKSNCLLLLGKYY